MRRNKDKIKHGWFIGTDVPQSTYNIWRNLKARCSNTNNPAYSRYGGRGITFCDKWTEFSGFIEDMGIRPDGMTLDRIDNDKGYYKENCRWASYYTQRHNQRIHKNCKLYYYDGEMIPIHEIAKRSGCSNNTLYSRLSNGWDVQRAIDVPLMTNRRNRRYAT